MTSSNQPPKPNAIKPLPSSDEDAALLVEDSDEIIFLDEDNDELVFSDDDEEEASDSSPSLQTQPSSLSSLLTPQPPMQARDDNAWTILIVDDDPSIRLVTRFALRDLTMEGFPMQLLEADSAVRAREILAQRADVALVITDVVMEDEASGLSLVSWIREQPHLSDTRLVIRTGQAGNAPELEVLREFDINDYWPKTAMTVHRIRTLTVGLLRSYRDLRRVEGQKAELHRLMKGLGALVSTRDVPTLTQALADTIENTASLSDTNVLFVNVSSADSVEQSMILGGTGKYRNARGCWVRDVLSSELIEMLQESQKTNGIVSRNGQVALLMRSDGTHATAFIADGVDSADPWSQDLLSVLCTNALALLNSQQESHAREELTKAAYRFVPEGLVHWLGRKDLTELDLGDLVKTRAWVMFCDLRGFTSRSEHLSPSDVLKMLLGAFELIVPVVRNHGGMIDKFLGDGIMVLFPASAPPPIRCAQALVERLAEHGHGLRAGIGIHGGDVVLCTLGHDTRIDVTAISDTVNVASRLESLTRTINCDILISGMVRDAIDPSDALLHTLIDHGTHTLQGRQHPIQVYELPRATAKEPTT